MSKDLKKQTMSKDLKKQTISKDLKKQTVEKKQHKTKADTILSKICTVPVAGGVPQPRQFGKAKLSWLGTPPATVFCNSFLIIGIVFLYNLRFFIILFFIFIFLFIFLKKK